MLSVNLESVPKWYRSSCHHLALYLNSSCTVQASLMTWQEEFGWILPYRKKWDWVGSLPQTVAELKKIKKTKKTPPMGSISAVLPSKLCLWSQRKMYTLSCVEMCFVINSRLDFHLSHCHHLLLTFQGLMGTAQKTVACSDLDPKIDLISYMNSCTGCQQPARFIFSSSI